MLVSISQPALLILQKWETAMLREYLRKSAGKDLSRLNFLTKRRAFSLPGVGFNLMFCKWLLM